MPKIRVLLVDDEVMIKNVLREKVNWEQFDMEISEMAGSAADALKYLESYPVDLVITDIKMPHMDGNTLIQRARSINHETRFLVFSAYTDYEIVRKSFKLGVFDYLQKSDIGTRTMNEVLIRLRNEITSGKAVAGEPVPDTAHPARLMQNKRYTVIRVNSQSGLIDNVVAKGIEMLEGDGTSLHVMERVPDGLTLRIEQGRSACMSSDAGKRRFVERLGRYLCNSGDFCIGVSSTGWGSSMEYLVAEAARAASFGFYTDGTSVVYQEDLLQHRDEPRLTADYWRMAVRKQLTCLNVEAALGSISEMLGFLKEARPEKERCRELVFDVYYFCVSFLNDNRIIPLDGAFETEHSSIDAVIRNINKFDKLYKWVEENLDQLRYCFLLRYKSGIVDIIKAYIHMNLSSDLSLDQIASLYDVNNSYMSHLFKQKEGISLKNYINKARLERARDLLDNTNMKIKDICDLVGYNNIEHFSRTFKGEYGSSPMAFRWQAQSVDGGTPEMMGSNESAYRVAD